ncbi:chemotaxis protein MotC [Rhizobium sp. SG_E_25_P2]|uniref:chemotaxis protein n=1 Tax=Rhizobium sp. SG_E_25_P2 TaxID=2879942 RepID=UPI0024749378|nr:chemotaxis protein [Rhizobium sp. SG_E_25_P2]MDH6266457.1 chemotaxis protein MotC [Rhizobium sp. SG_E_25_P2]
MSFSVHIRRAFLTVGVSLLALAAAARAEDAAPVDAAEPYKLVRSLQNIQDQVISGDISALDMQRFLLEEIDRRLREADASVFDDTRNVDAALIYAMSGGNPSTLDLLAQRDVSGNFDNRITSILRRYLNGRGAGAVKQLKEVVPEYRYTTIGPYLQLIGANAMMETDKETALKYFDWARLEAPGTIIEEAALRRALMITSRSGDTAAALPYARRYARRYMNSPYASQFADIFVALAIDHPKALPPVEIEASLELVERRRQREIFLRLARRAAINGDKPLTDFAAGRAKALSEPDEASPLALAKLYSGLVDIPSDGIEDVLNRLGGIADQDLSPKDRFLRDAARIVAAEVMAPPNADSLAQANRDMADKEYRDRMSALALDAETTGSTDPTAASVSEQPAASETAPRSQALDARMDQAENLVASGRARLKDIDALLAKESE